MLLSRSTPSYDRDGDDKGHRRHEWDPKMDANDPANFRTATDEEEFIR